MKERITISVENSAISLIDSKIGRNNIQNRSQAIESIIFEYFSAVSQMKAIILAGKKPSEESIKETLKYLEQIGATELLIAGGKNNEELFTIINSNNYYKERTTFLKETKELGTAGIIKSAEAQINGPFFVIYSDITYNLNFKDMLEHHKNSKNLSTIAVTTPEKKSDIVDNIKVNGNKITEFEYKSSKPTKLQNAGIFIFEKSALDFFPTKGTLEDDVLPGLAKSGKLGLFLFDSNWKHKG